MNRLTTINLLSVDNDHTMLPFFWGAVPAWRQSLPAVARLLELPLELVGQELGTVFAKYCTHDCPYALSVALGKYWRGSHKEFVRRVERPYWRLQDRMRNKYVRPFAGVRKTLRTLNRLGLPTVIVSDAPMFMCLARIVGARMDHYFQGVYALEVKRPQVSDVPGEEWLQFGDDRVAEFKRRFASSHIRFVREMPLEFEKPDPRGIQLAMSDFGVEAERVIHVGDSLPKDGRLALHAKLRGFVYTPDYAIGNLPGEYLEMITEVLKPKTDEFAGHGATPAPVQTRRVLQPPMLGRGAFLDVLQHVFPANEATVNPNFRA